jgi:DNA-binding beta-propeller fold protein YncE
MFKSTRHLSLPAALLLLSCGGPSGGIKPETTDSPIPVAVLVERVISGPVLGIRLQNPVGLAADAGGNIYLADAGNNRVIRFDSILTARQEVGGQGRQAGLLNNPSYLSVDNNLNIVVSEEGNRRVSRFNTNLNFVDVTDFYNFEDQTEYGYPSGVAVTAFGEMWVADREKNRLVVFDRMAKFDRFVGDFAHSGGQVSNPGKLLIDEGGNIIACDAGNHRLVVYDEYGNYLGSIRHKSITSPVAAAEDRERLWVLDGDSGALYSIDFDGNLVFSAGPLLSGSDLPLKYPSDIVALPGDRLLISDSGNNRLVLCKAIYDR